VIITARRLLLLVGFCVSCVPSGAPELPAPASANSLGASDTAAVLAVAAQFGIPSLLTSDIHSRSTWAVLSSYLNRLSQSTATDAPGWSCGSGARVVTRAVIAVRCQPHPVAELNT